MKQVIRLTESDLHRVIKESVRQVISELDWKTYVNAARKRSQQKEKGVLGVSDEEFELHQAAKKSLNDKYPNRKYRGERDEYRDYIDYELEPFLGSDGAGLQQRALGRDKASWPGVDTRTGIIHHTHFKPNTKPQTWAQHVMMYGGEESRLNHQQHLNGTYTTPQRKNPEGAEWDFDNISQEMQDYYDGNYEYQKGKGWVKK